MSNLLRLALWLGLTSNYLLGRVQGHAALRQQPQLLSEDHHPVLERKANHRELQRVASNCAADPTAFSTSIYVNHVGDGTRFQEDDLNQLLKFALTTYNQLTATTCDATFRTLQSVSVSSVFYTEELDFVRLRYDFTGQCDGCVPGELESGIGPLFGDFENLGRRRTKQQQQQPQTPSESNSHLHRRIKGFNGGRRQLKKEDGKPIQTRKLKRNRLCDCVGSDRQGGEQRGPTTSEFATALNDMISSARSGGMLSGVQSVDEVFEAGIAGHSTVLPASEARDVSCVNQQDFTTDVWVEFFAGSDLTVPEKIPMEVAILETFNEMVLSSCDVPFFRTVSDVSHVETRASGNDYLQMKFAVSGKCVNCDPATIDLFGTNPVESTDPSAIISLGGFRAPSRALLMSEIERVEQANMGPFVVVREVPASCVCLLNEEGLPLRSPTEREFSQVLQQTISTLVGENVIFSVREVSRVGEHRLDGQCSTEVTNFESVFFADFNGKPELLQDLEIATLEDGFMQSYNDLIFNSCDSYFRAISDVKLIPGISRRRALQGNGMGNPDIPGAGNPSSPGVGNPSNTSDVPDLQSEAPSVYLVAGQCRGCPVTPGGSFSLTDDAFRFRKLMVGDKEETMACYSYTNAIDGLYDLQLPGRGEGDLLSRFENAGRRLQIADQCVCAAGVFPERPTVPSPDSFRMAYNVKIVEYNTAGSVQNVEEVSHLIEVPPGLVTVPFSIFYGTLARLGNPSAADYGPLEHETGRFYRTRLMEHFDNVANVTLHAVTIKRANETTIRPDLDKLEVPFSAELIFDDMPGLPSAQDVSRIMSTFNYVDYITDYIWSLNTPGNAPGAPLSIFRQTHSVRFAGMESATVDVRLLFTTKADRTIQAPNMNDRQGLQQQLDQFFLDYLNNAGLYVSSFASHIDAEGVSITGAGLVLVDFDATIGFSTVAEIPSQAEIYAIIKDADLDPLKTQLLRAPPTGTAVFNNPFEIDFSN